MDVSPVLLLLYRGQAAEARELAKTRTLDIFEAAALGVIDRLREILAQSPQACRDRAPDGFGALGLAAYFGQPEAAELLIAAGAPVDEPSANHMKVHPLHSAVAARQLDIARRLLERGADPNARQHGGYVPLHSAAQHGDLALAKLLCQHGADKQARSDDGKTPADFAREKGHHELAQWLAS